LTPLSLAGGRLVRSLCQRHPSLFARLGEQADKVFLIDPIDLPFVFRLEPRADGPRLEALRRSACGRWDARIGGTLAALLGMIHGVYDGDALFFSRDLVIEGDTEAVLALRNAIDNEEIDLANEAAALFGPLAFLASAPARRIASLLGNLSGVALTRGERERQA
jgi:predicted lipid carrier protein YhbT